MAKYGKIFVTDNEKKMEKVKSYLQNGAGAAYLNEFLREAQNPRTKQLEKVMITITDNYVCCYSFYGRKELYIIPLKDIVNVYSSNCFFGKFDYDMKAIAVETNDKKIYYLSTCMFNQKVPDYNEAIETMKTRCKENEGSLMA